MGSTLSLVKSHVSMCARTTVARSLCSSSSSAATAFSRVREFELCCMAAKMRAFSLLGTRPNLTAVKKEININIFFLKQISSINVISYKRTSSESNVLKYRGAVIKVN